MKVLRTMAAITLGVAVGQVAIVSAGDRIIRPDRCRACEACELKDVNQKLRVAIDAARRDAMKRPLGASPVRPDVPPADRIPPQAVPVK